MANLKAHAILEKGPAYDGSPMCFAADLFGRDGRSFRLWQRLPQSDAASHLDRIRGHTACVSGGGDDRDPNGSCGRRLG